jgi:hypothetical protein
VPETLGPVWLWAWSSPQCVSAPFLAHPPVGVIERPVNYSRSDQWTKDRHPLEQIRAASEAVALFVDGTGAVFCRRVSREDLQRHSEKLAGVVTSESWTEWVRSLAQP